MNQDRQIDARPSSEKHLHHARRGADPQFPHYGLLKQLNVTCVRFITHPCVSRLCAHALVSVMPRTDVSICRLQFGPLIRV